MSAKRRGRGVRVTGGDLRGRRVRVTGSGVRPTADRVRESLFSQLGDLGGIAVLDLYAGSGILGIESASRGAERVVCVERSPRSVDALRARLRELALDRNVTVLQGDAVRVIGRLGRAGERFGLVLLDPPYAGGELTRALRALARASLVASHGRVVAEHGRRHPVPALAGWRELEQRRYSDTLLTHLEPAPDRQGEPPER